MTTYFIGLGPKGDRVTESELLELLNGSSELGNCVLELRSRGSCAFATLAEGVDGGLFCQTFDGKTVNDCRLSIQPARDRRAEAAAVQRGGAGGSGVENDGLTVFIGLGPQHATVTDEALRSSLEENGGPVNGEIRRRGQCAFADFHNTTDANRAVSTLHGITLGECRLSVQISRNDRRGNGNDRHRHNDRFGGRGGHDSRGGRNGGGDRKRDRSRSRRRSRSRSRRDDSRRRHRSGSRRGRRDDREERDDRRSNKDREDRRERRRSPS